MALEFDGASDNVNIGSAAALDNIFTGGGSVCCWAYPTGFGGDGVGTMLSKNSASAFGEGWNFFVSNNNDTFGNILSLSFVHTDSGAFGYGSWTTAASTISLNTAWHFAVTFNKDNIANNAVLYINGISFAVTEKNTPTGSFASDAAESLLLGAGSNANKEFAGILEDCRLYNRILTANEVRTIAAAKGHDNIINGLIARWLLKEQQDGTAAPATANYIKDISPNGNNGTAASGPIYRGGLIAPKRRFYNG